MGQFALGIRSLFIRLAIFFVMAALLAWALGGTLWPRAEMHDFAPVTFDGKEWFWRVAVGGREPNSIGWMMMQRAIGAEPRPYDGRVWRDAAGPALGKETLAFAGRAGRFPTDAWHYQIILSSDGRSEETLPDRLAVELALAEVRGEASIGSSGAEDH